MTKFIMKYTIYTVLILLFFGACSMSNAALIQNHRVWHDTDGARIDCHEGAIIRVGDTFYWYGRRYEGNPEGIYGTKGAGFRCGFCCYSSTDLVHWKNLGMILSYPKSGWLTEGTWHRPRMIYNALTKKYVLWFFVLADKYPCPVVVATADSPSGQFSIMGRVKNNYLSGDLSFLLDDDGQGYICRDDARKCSVEPLAPDFLSPLPPQTIALPTNEDYEGDCIVRYKGKYMVAASGVNGLAPSDTHYAMSDSPLGPYTYKGLLNPKGNLTWNSQIGSFFYLKESNVLMILCDQWLTGAKGERVTAEKSQQIWLPVQFDSKTGTAQIVYAEQWDPFAPSATPNP